MAGQTSRMNKLAREEGNEPPCCGLATSSSSSSQPGITQTKLTLLSSNDHSSLASSSLTLESIIEERLQGFPQGHGPVVSVGPSSEGSNASDPQPPPPSPLSTDAGNDIMLRAFNSTITPPDSSSNNRKKTADPYEVISFIPDVDNSGS